MYGFPIKINIFVINSHSIFKRIKAEKVKAFHKYLVIKLQIIATCWETKINTNMM